MRNAREFHGFAALLAVSVCLVLALAVPVSASVVNMGPSATAYGSHTPSSQGSPSGVNDNDPNWTGAYYGSTDNPATGYYYLNWAQTKTVRTIRWMASNADISRKLSDFTVSQLTGPNPANPADWTLIPGCTVTGNSASEVDFNLPSDLSTKGIRVDYANQVRPLTGELEVFDQVMNTPANTVYAINQLYGAPADAADHNALTNWGSGGLNNGPGWAYLDFGQDKTIAGLRLRWRVQGGYYQAPQDWQLETWNSNTNTWNAPFQSITNWGAAAPLYETDLSTPVTTSRIRVYASVPRVSSNIAGGSMGLWDFEAVQALAAPVPEPATLGLVTLGAFGLILRRKA